MVVAETEVVRALLSTPTNPVAVRKPVAPNATYVSIDFDNLRQSMPWPGAAPDAVLNTYAQARRFWHSEVPEIVELFDAGDNVAVLGRFPLRSVTPGKAASSPFAVLAAVRGGQITSVHLVEDTFVAAATFRGDGVATYRSDPGGSEVSL